MSDESGDSFEGFGSKAVHSGTKHVGDAVNTPIFQSSTYKLTDERYAGWAAGAHHTLLYARITSVNAEAVCDKLRALEGGEDAEGFAGDDGVIGAGDKEGGCTQAGLPAPLLLLLAGLGFWVARRRKLLTSISEIRIQK